MKILEVCFKNLNSLRGRWKINFETPEYASTGIFAITGPTGSGKSTILDAICLALYGQTPRLAKVNKTENEVMSRGTFECYSEVVFESNNVKYRCQWEQHRANKRVSGDLQPPHHQISYAVDGKIIESKITTTARVVEEKTGMDFNRFIRSVLLPQGAFDNFLKSENDEKSEILEQITGTEIYTDISKSVFERKRDEKIKLDSYKATLEGIEILSSENESNKRAELKKKQGESEKQLAVIEKIRKQIEWLERIVDLENQKRILENQKVEYDQKDKAFQPRRNQLDEAKRASELDVIYTELNTLRNRKSEIEKDLINLNDQFLRLKASKEEQKQKKEEAENLYNTASEDYDKARSIITDIKKLDVSLREQNNHIQAKGMDLKNIQNEIIQKEKERKEKQGRLDDQSTELIKLEDYGQKHFCDQILVEQFAAIEIQLNHLSDRQESINGKKATIERQKQILNQYEENCSQRKKFQSQKIEKEKSLVEEIEKVKNDKINLLDGKELREYKTERDNLQKEKEYLSIIKSLEDHRKKLKDGNPCPLCGAKEHPYAIGNIPQPDEIELKISKLDQFVQKVEGLEVTIQQREIELGRISTELKGIRGIIETEETNKNNAQNQLEVLKNELNELVKTESEQKRRLLVILEQLGHTEIQDNVQDLLNNLQQRLALWNQNIENKKKCADEINRLKIEIHGIDEAIKTKHVEQKNIECDLEKKNSRYNREKTNRQELYGDKDPNVEEENLIMRKKVAEQKRDNALNDYNESEKALSGVEKLIKSSKQELEDVSRDWEQRENEFKTQLCEKGFQSEEQFKSVRLRVDDIKKLEKEQNTLKEEKISLKTKYDSCLKTLESEKEKHLTDQDISGLKVQLGQLNLCQNQLQQAIGALNNELSLNENNRQRFKEQQKVIEEQQKVSDRWDRLNELIGSSDGKKFRNFAQGLTFAIMLNHANDQLGKMSSRYQLVSNSNEPLELKVIDSWQGEVRPVKNLSGGESFIVSLSLALGLSQMASHKVQVDSLFLDEGFGTLDEKALEQVLQTLCSLHQANSNKLIGIISHVKELGERIPTHIEVIPQEGINLGNSCICGAGVEGK